MFIARIKSRLSEFVRREDGVITIEAMIIMPVMFWAFLAMFSIFDTFRTYGINQKAAFTIGDSISRETEPLDQAYLNGSLDMFRYLSLSREQVALRVSSLYYDATEDRFYADWSKTSGTVVELLSDDVEEWGDRLPLLPDGERIMLVETWSEYEPPFATGLEHQEIRNFVFTRPRFAPRVCWEECN